MTFTLFGKMILTLTSNLWLMARAECSSALMTDV